MSFLEDISGIEEPRSWRVEDEGIDLAYDADFLPTADADRLFEKLMTLPWHRDQMPTPGGLKPFPRLLTWHADEGRTYRYSGVTHPWCAWTPELAEIRDRLETKLGVRFNGVLGNLYQNERDSISAHSDDETDLVPGAPIASLSLGAVRKFIVRHVVNKSRHVVELGHGSLVVMAGATQRVAEHSIPKLKDPCGPRINLTYRVMQ
jgi:alkylated DNA repair dioxygenase AlkB